MADNRDGQQRRVCVLVSSDGTVKAFLLGHVEALSVGFDVTVSANCEEQALRRYLPRNVAFVPNGVVRPVKLMSDCRELISLALRFRREGYWAVQTVTPKAGLLGMLAARLAGVPVRVHIFTGQVWATKSGFRRSFLKLFDRVIAACATTRLVDSSSQLDFLVAEGVLSRDGGKVIGNGSIAGVDTDRFRPDEERRARVRRELDLQEAEVMCLFVGRLKLEKGVVDLVEAFVLAKRQVPLLRLVLVGEDEEGLSPDLRKRAGEAVDSLALVGTVSSPEDYMAAADLFCLPSYREGFGVSVLEAGACQLPTVASRIYGLTDAVVEDVTGWLHTPGGVHELSALLVTMAQSPEVRAQFGDAARRRAITKFSATESSRQFARMFETPR